MERSRISNTYSGRHTNYTLEVDGDDVIIEYLKPDQTTVINGYKSAQILCQEILIKQKGHFTLFSPIIVSLIDQRRLSSLDYS